MDEKMNRLLEKMPPELRQILVAELFKNSLMSPYAVIMSAAFKQLDESGMDNEEQCELYLKLCTGNGGSGNHQLDVCAMIIGCGMELFRAQAKLLGLDNFVDGALKSNMDRETVDKLLRDFRSAKPVKDEEND